MQHAIWFILLFLSALTALGIYHTRSIKTGEDFALAGRRLGPGVLIGTLVATWIGTGSIFGNAEFTYEHGMAGLFLPLSGLAGMIALSFLAPRVREIPADSVPQILAIRFGRSAQVLGAIALIVAYLIIVSYQYRAGAALAGKLFPQWEEHAKLFPVFFALFVILYTVLAGMVSVAWTDLINGLLMAIGLLIAVGFVLSDWNTQGQSLPAEYKEPSGGLTALAWVGVTLPAFLLMLGDANLYQRFMSARSPAVARVSALGMFVGVLVLEWAIILIALGGRVLLPEAPDNPAHVVIDVAFTPEIVPPGIGILLAMTAVAVIVTTADSYLLGSATSAATDMFGGLTTPWKQRFIVILLGLIALGLSFTSDKFFSVALYAYTLYGATLTPALLCALFFPRTNGIAVVAGMASGLGVAVLWKALSALQSLPDIFSVLAELPHYTAYVWKLPALLHRGFTPIAELQLDAVLPALAANVLVLLALAWALPSGGKKQSPAPVV